MSSNFTAFHPGERLLCEGNATGNNDSDCFDPDSDARQGGHLPMALMTVIQIFYALVCVVGLCGNTLVIYVVLR